MEERLSNKELTKKLMDDYLRMRMNGQEKLGIPDIGFVYHMVSDNQDRGVEYLKTEEFLKWIVINNIAEFANVFDIKFINYGSTELVYVVCGPNFKKTLLVGQPNNDFGTVKKEYDNLKMLAKLNPQLVVCPTNYFSNGNREAYLTPYIYQARCIASFENRYGAYVPEPNYTFIPYNDEDTYTICKAMIANLILLYNHDLNLGLASCKVGGGDFILEKEYDKEIHSVDNTLKRMHLIAARELIKIDLDSYINLLKNEFRIDTCGKDNILVNHKNSAPMPLEIIEDGIQLGLKLKYK